MEASGPSRSVCRGRPPRPTRQAPPTTAPASAAAAVCSGCCPPLPPQRRPPSPPLLPPTAAPPYAHTRPRWPSAARGLSSWRVTPCIDAPPGLQRPDHVRVADEEKRLGGRSRVLPGPCWFGEAPSVSSPRTIAGGRSSTACCRGDMPLVPHPSGNAPATSSAPTTSAWPPRNTMCTGTRPPVLTKLGPAAATTKLRIGTSQVASRADATCRAVKPARALASASAPATSSAFTTSERPRSTASWSGEVLSKGPHMRGCA